MNVPHPNPGGAVATILLFIASCLFQATAADADTSRVGVTTELHRAIKSGDAVKWRALLAAGSHVDERDGHGNTPLHVAAQHVDVAAVRALLERGADANATNAAKATPLLYGTADDALVETLLKHNADPNAVSAEGITPLMAAVSHGESFAVVRRLIESGANVRAAR